MSGYDRAYTGFITNRLAKQEQLPILACKTMPPLKLYLGVNLPQVRHFTRGEQGPTQSHRGALCMESGVAAYIHADFLQLLGPGPDDIRVEQAGRQQGPLAVVLQVLWDVADLRP